MAQVAATLGIWFFSQNFQIHIQFSRAIWDINHKSFKLVGSWESSSARESELQRPFAREKEMKSENMYIEYENGERREISVRHSEC